MRDVLEELLDAQEEAGTGEEPARWTEGPVILGRRGRDDPEGRDGEDGLPGTRSAAAMTEERDGGGAVWAEASVPTGGPVPETGGGVPRGRALPWPADGAERAGAGGVGPVWAPAPAVWQLGKGAEGLYRALLRTGQAAGYVRRDMGYAPLSHYGTEERAPALGAAELDRIFQRDARRYDGGFPLY